MTNLPKTYVVQEWAYIRLEYIRLDMYIRLEIGLYKTGLWGKFPNSLCETGLWGKFPKPRAYIRIK